jgi:hypothetical protein
MRILPAEFESTDMKDKSSYDFLGNELLNISTEPFFLRHEYYDNEKDLKQSLCLFGRRKEEPGAQIFLEMYYNYKNNIKYLKEVEFYQNQQSNFRLSGGEKLSNEFLLPVIHETAKVSQMMTKDGKYRKRILYDIKGEKNALLLVFSLDSNAFSENQLFCFLKKNLKINIK